jgi:hypothetical protein
LRVVVRTDDAGLIGSTLKVEADVMSAHQHT